MALRFVNREKELEELNKRYKSKKAEFFVIYGRRRVGKTELIKEFVKDKPHFYFLAKEQDIGLERERFQKMFAKKFDVYIESESFEEFFSDFQPEKKFVFVIDEFPYWISKKREIVSEFQYLWDEILKSKNVFLILCGSSVSMMEDQVLAYKSPLYGRRTGQIKVQEFAFRELFSYFPDNSFEQNLKIYGAVGGIPFYLEQFKDKFNLKDTFFNKANILFEEAEILLREELREVNTYFNIMKTLEEGATKLNEIATKSKVSITNINKYLNVLINLGFVKKNYAVTRSKPLYKVSDNYFKFWLNFVYPNKTHIEENVDSVIELVKSNYSRYLGPIFEDVCREYVKYPKVGTWWYKDTEIDIVAVDESKSKILFGECKWSDDVDAKKLLEELKQKAKKVKWHKNRKEEYVLFAKSFSNKADAQLVDLKDLEEYFGERK